MASHEPSAYSILDVRQPREYEAGHIPGASLIPLPEIDERLREIDAEKPVIVYCASGGRSRAAVQFLCGKGFDNAVNMSGGFKAWEGEAAFDDGLPDLKLFNGDVTAEEALMAVYSVEIGMEDFYKTMIPKLNHPKARSLFETLAGIEISHRERIVQEYRNVTGEAAKSAAFEKKAVESVVEGGLTTEEYINLFKPDWNHLSDIVDIAMSIEAQAYDLYMRAADGYAGTQSGASLLKMADEERNHMVRLGKLFDEAE